MSNVYTSTKYDDFYQNPKFNISTEPHYKIRKYLEENTINVPNKKILNKIISTALNKKKYQGTMDLNVPGNKNVLTDSDSEGQYYNMKKINKNMQKKNGCADLIITKIESQAPQRNEEYYKFTNKNKFYANNDPIYGTRTLTNWNHQIINAKKIKPVSPLYIPNEQNNYYKNRNNNNYNYNVYTTNNKILTTSDTSRLNRLNEESNFKFNSTVDLNQINVKKNKNRKQINGINKSPNQQISYESSAEAEQGSSSYVYHPAKINVRNRNTHIKKNIYKDNEFSLQSNSNNEEPYIKKNLEINNEKIIPKPKNSLYKAPKKKPSLKELINLNQKNKEFSVLQNKFNQKLIKSVIIIQSAWRGYITRDIIKKNLNLIRFAVILVENIKNKYLDYISDIFYDLKNTKINSERNENYNDLLKDYNFLLNEYNKIEKEMNQIKKIQKINKFDNLNIVNKENNFEILDINLDNSDNNNNKEKRIINDNIKIFDIIKPEQKEEFSIIKIKNEEEKPKLRNIYKKYNHENQNDNKFEENINHFTSNINIINNINFMLNENKTSLPTSKANNIITKVKCLSLLSTSKDKKDLDIINTNPILSNENQQIIEQPRKFKENIIKENNNDINIKPTTINNNLDKNKIFCKLHHKFDEDNLVIVKKSNINIHCEKTKNSFIVDKNTLYIKKSKKLEEKIIIKDKNDFNKINEIDKRDSLEINTLEMKKSNEKETKSENILTEKAKKNIMRIILPIRLKKVLKEFVQRIIFTILKNQENN